MQNPYIDLSAHDLIKAVQDALNQLRNQPLIHAGVRTNTYALAAALDKADLATKHQQYKEYAEANARMWTESDHDDDGGVLENDDAVDTVNYVIRRARDITGIPAPVIEPKEEE